MTAVGLIVPPLEGRVPPDAAAMYPDVEFLVEGLGLAAMAQDAYAAALLRVEEASRRLAERGAEALLLYGTSLSFFGGPSGNRVLESRMAAASGLPTQTLTSALVEGLRSLSARKIAVATAYDADVDALFVSYFREEGFEILSIGGMGLVSLTAAENTGEEAVAEIARRVHARAPEAEAVVVSCAGLTTSTICPRLEDEFAIPVISSAMAGAWAAVRLAGHQGGSPGHGRLYS
ncbi:arylmalonate decarboxylase [Amorphus suaedae]